MRRAFKYRLYPNVNQTRELETALETLRRLYNQALEIRMTAYKTEKRSVNFAEQSRWLTEARKLNPWYENLNRNTAQSMLKRLDKAFQAFFRRLKAGENPGYPRFKKRGRFAGFGFKEYGNGFKVDGRRLKLSGIGRIAVRWHRELEGKVKTARVYCRAGKWFVSFACEIEKSEPLAKTGIEVGVDVGLHRLATLSSGEEIENPRWYRKILRELRVLQRKIARCVFGGRNRRKLILRLQRLMVHVANARKDFLNKFAAELIQRFDRIVLEDLRVAAMVRGHFAMSILDAGWSYLVTRLTHKAENAGREIVLIDPAYTSKTCSGCGALFEHLTLSDRWVSCDCGVSIDRDHNAAINILQRGRNRPLGVKFLIGEACPEAAAL